ncbi:MAG: hypothetical protein AAF529_08175 [Pseudomonadota bacterium]
MNTQTLPRLPSLSAGLQDFKSLQPLWYQNALGWGIFMVLCLLLAALDDRTLNGVSVWSKPFKFSLSLVAYFGTLTWFVRFLTPQTLQSVSGRALVWIPVVMAGFEMAYMTTMAAMAQPSHFNVSTPFHALMYSLMGFGAVSIVLVLGWMAALIARQNGVSNPLVLAVVLGLGLTLLLGGGFGGYLGGAGSHWVQAPATDVDGLALFNWSREGGDLRVAHFFGMHAMQALPIFALLLPVRWPQHMKIAMVIGFAAAYSAFTTVTFVQAVQGQPFMA